MSFKSGREGEDTVGTGELGGGVAPGKRSATERLPAVQRRAAPAAATPDPSAPAAHHEDPYGVHLIAERGVEGAGGALPHLDTIQASFGGDHDLAAVQAHVGGPAAAASAQLGAAAYASGTDVAFAQSPDLHTAAHEAAHVVQQAQGVNLYGGVGEAGDAYERHADLVADRVVAGASASDLLGAPTGAGGGGGGATVQKKDLLGSAVEAVANLTMSPQDAAQAGAAFGTDANIDEAGTDPTKDRLQAFRTAVSAGVVADIETTFAALKKGDRRKLRDETDTLTRLIQVLGPPSMKALASIGIGFAEDPRWSQHILWQANVADWKAQMTSSQWRQFIHAEPRQDALDDQSLQGLNQAMKVAGNDANARDIFNRAYPKLQTSKALVEDDWTKAKTEPWTDDRVARLFDILATGGMPRSHVMAASGGFLLVSKTRERELDTDPWGPWASQGFAYWDDTSDLIVLPLWSADDAAAYGHNMVGGDGARSHTPVSKLTHFQGSAMHEVGHAVGDNIRGHTWAQTASPAQWQKMTAAELTALWDAAKNVPAPAGDTALPEADAKTYMLTALTTGTGTLPAAGWTNDTLERMLGMQYFEQALYKIWRGTKAKGEAFRAPVESGGFYYAFMSRWDDQVGRYTKEAFDSKVSWYSMSSPNEWFAEQYVQYYRTNKVGTGMHADTVAYMRDIDTRSVANPGADPAAPAAPAPAPAPSPGGDTEGGEAVASADGEAERTTDAAPKGRPRPRRRQFAWAW